MTGVSWERQWQFRVTWSKIMSYGAFDYKVLMKGRFFMSIECTVYIDEAGDLGIGRGTQWFVLTAVIVNKDSEPKIRSIMASVKKRLNLDNIHFRNLRSFEQRAYVVNQISNSCFEYVNVILDTSKLDIGKLNARKDDLYEKPGIFLYNHACRYLVERVSWLLRDTDRKGKIMLSSRGTSRDAELIEYLNKLINNPNHTISDCFTGICSKTAESWDMLQLADICATSMFYYHEVNAYGFVLPCYTKKLYKFLYQRNGTVDKYGIKYYTDEMKPNNTYFSEHLVCK